MFSSLDISTSALVAHRTRLEVVANNLANRHSILDANGNYSPFRRRLAILAPGDAQNGQAAGVHVREIAMDQSPFLKRLESGNPYADQDGYVNYPNIDPTTEQINAIEAARAYEASIVAAEATKQMLQSSLRLLA